VRILYGAGNRVGANSQLYRFLSALDKKHIVAVAAYSGSSFLYSKLNWSLDALHYNTIAKKSKRIMDRVLNIKLLLNVENLKVLVKEIGEFEPDIIINDCEPITATIARSLNIKLWYCSPLHLLGGIVWEKDQLKYRTPIIAARKLLNKLPDPDRCFIYSPFGDVRNRPILKSGFNWITPYFFKSNVGNGGITAIINDMRRFSELSRILNGSNYNIKLFSPFKEEFSNLETYLSTDTQKYIKALNSSDTIFTTGETSYISDAFYSGHRISIAPYLNDAESLINARLSESYDLGTDLHQVEFMEHYALSYIEDSFKKENAKNYLSCQNRKQLHEEICDI
jgi:hypothetical protein